MIIDKRVLIAKFQNQTNSKQNFILCFQFHQTQNNTKKQFLPKISNTLSNSQVYRSVELFKLLMLCPCLNLPLFLGLGHEREACKRVSGGI